MNFPLTNLQDFEQLVTTLFAESKCACHVINPHKTRILMWKETKENVTTYHLRIGIQKFISQEQVDRNGEIYWRYYSSEVKKEEKKPEVNEESKELDPITKFNQRQTQAQDYAKSNISEPTVNEQSN